MLCGDCDCWVVVDLLFVTACFSCGVALGLAFLGCQLTCHSCLVVVVMGCGGVAVMKLTALFL